MKILHFSPHSGGPMYDWHNYHYFDELTREGHTVIDCNPVSVLKRKGTAAEYSEILVDTAKRVFSDSGPHLLFSKATDMTLLAGAVDFVKSMGVPAVNLSVDDMTVPFDVTRIGRHFDLCWTTYLGTDAQLRKLGCNVIYLPMAANPYYFSRNTSSLKHVLGFIGSKYGARSSYISHLAHAHVPLVVRGAGWLEEQDQTAVKPTADSGSIKESLRVLNGFARFPGGRKMIYGALKKRLFALKDDFCTSQFPDLDLAGPLSTFEEMVSCYSNCTASLGILEAGSTYTLKNPLVYYRLREFEAPMIGCAHIVRRVPELEECFVDGQEMIFYSSLEECIDKAVFYMSPERFEVCQAIGQNARVRAVRDHSWLRRFSALCTKLGIKLSPND